MSGATKVVRGLMLVLGAVGLFSAGLVGTLAARGKPLVTRVTAILEIQRNRQPVTAWAWALGMSATLLVTLPLASLDRLAIQREIKDIGTR